ncbi:MAG: RluA family pseudouridine synthase [Spirochaetaceae bacterium]|nr:RluA family pseudouridine synthase [Spirochaetaceae bacterium]
MTTVRLETGLDDEGRRLDRVLRRACAELPISAIHRLLRKGFVSVDGKRAGQAERVRSGQVIEILGAELPCAADRKKSRGGSSIGDGVEVLYEGQGLLVLNKPPGITTQEELGALALEYLTGKTSPSLSFRPGPLHRLDKGTSGIIVFGSSLAGAKRFSALMRGGLLRKTYIALLEGSLIGERLWQDSLAYSASMQKSRVNTAPGATAKRARTRVFPLELHGGFTLAAMEIATGRRHQIRVQSAARGFPLYGDAKYGGRERAPFFLHACRLDFPEGCPFPRSISAPLPPAFQKKLLQLCFTRADQLRMNAGQILLNK